MRVYLVYIRKVKKLKHQLGTLLVLFSKNSVSE